MLGLFAFQNPPPFFRESTVFGFQRQKETIFVFVHLPRCAGTFLLKSFSWLGSRRQVVVSRSPNSKAEAKSFLEYEIQSRKISPEKLELISGHDAYFGIHSVSPRKPFYFTFLRDPTERYLSNFRFLRDCAVDPRSFVHDFAVEAMLDNGKQRPLEQLVEQGRLANMMTHFLAAAVESDLSTPRWHHKDPEKLLSLAKSAIDRFEFIGFYEQLEADAKFICDRLRVPLKVRRVNQTKSQLMDPVSACTRLAIEEINDLDFALFQYAQNRARHD